MRARPDTATNAKAAMVPVDRALTEKQKLFVKLWAQGESISTASARAGYNDAATYAYRMTKMPNILALYQKEKDAYEEASQMTRKKVMDMFIESYDMAKLEADPHAMVSAAREIGKMCGYYAPTKSTLTINHTGSVRLNQLNAMTDSELAELVGAEDGSDVLTQIGVEVFGDDAGDPDE